MEVRRPVIGKLYYRIQEYDQVVDFEAKMVMLVLFQQERLNGILEAH